MNDTKSDLLDPAIIGTTGILKAAKKSVPTLKRLVITSSFASIIDGSKGTRPGHVYSEADVRYTIFIHLRVFCNVQHLASM